LHAWHAAHGARFTDRDGWQVVAMYSDAGREAEATRAGLGLADISALAKISVRGAGVPDLVRSLAPDGPALSPHGVAVLPARPALACRLAADHLLLLSPTPSASGLWQRVAGARQDGPVVPTDVTSAYAGFLLLGPRLDEVMRRLTHLDLRAASFPVNSCGETALAGVEALLVRATETSLPALRVYVPWDVAEFVWERMLEAGRDVPVAPLGREALALLDAGPGPSPR
jgi:heterotetrameric sarcosine oxidase gamma subunit